MWTYHHINFRSTLFQDIYHWKTPEATVQNSVNNYTDINALRTGDTHLRFYMATDTEVSGSIPGATRFSE